MSQHDYQPVENESLLVIGSGRSAEANDKLSRAILGNTRGSTRATPTAGNK